VTGPSTAAHQGIAQAVLPILREQGSGRVIQTSTIGRISAFPSLGGSHAAKWALEGLIESLAQEVAGFGIKVTLVEPGGFHTDWGSASAVVADARPEYAAIHEAMASMASGPQPKPNGFGSAILKVIDAKKAPLRGFFGERPTVGPVHLPAASRRLGPVSPEADGK